jgi:DNA polymerase-3 subunit epsilon
LARLPENAHLLESAHAAYLEVLDRALEDRHVSPDEAELLFEIADGWKIGRETVGSLHKSYVHSVADAAWADGVISEAERLDLEWVAGALGEAELLEELLRAPFVDGIATERHSSAGLEGRSVCFTGALLCTRRGYGITRTDAEALATKAGLVVQHNVTKKLDVLVVADPDTQSGKACRAREYGTRILAERMFWKGIGVDVD